MELRPDMLESWRLFENERLDETVAVKLVLPRGSDGQVTKYLEEAGVVESFIYPDKAGSDAHLP